MSLPRRRESDRHFENRSGFFAHTSDRLLTLGALTGQPLLKRPLDVTPALDDRHKLVIHDGKMAAHAKTELFDLEADPEEKTDISKLQPERLQQLQTKLRTWQASVLKSLTGGD